MVAKLHCAMYGTGAVYNIIDDKGNMISRGQIQRSITCTEAAAQSPEHPLMLCQKVHDIANKDSI
jgi:hypothetical protein